MYGKVDSIFQAPLVAAISNHGDAVATGMVPSEAGQFTSPAVRLFCAAGEGVDAQSMYVGGKKHIAALRDLCDAVLRAVPANNGAE